jgi:hypothetical protein
VLDHIGVPVSDFEQSKRFYTEALSPLGYELIMEPGVSAAGLGRWGKPDFWISQGEPGQAFHIAFAADDRATVDAFHEAAMAAVGATTAVLGFAPSTMQATMEPSSSILTATISKRSAMGQNRKLKMPELLFPGCVEVAFPEVRDLCSMMGRSDKKEYSSA